MSASNRASGSEVLLGIACPARRWLLSVTSLPALLLTVLSVFVSDVNTILVHSIHWNASNPIFRIDNTDNVFDINQGNLPWEYDQLNLICPWYGGLGGPPSSTRSQEDLEQYIIYNVSKEEYDSCRISQKDPRIVAVCNKPNAKQQFTITFRSFSPTPRGLEFRPGQDYYFISTSGPGDLYRRWGGACATHNMKVVFKVADNIADDSSLLAVPPYRDSAVNRPRTSINSPRRGFDRQDFYADTDEDNGASATSIPTDKYVRPIEDVRSFHNAAIDRLSVVGDVSGEGGPYPTDLKTGGDQRYRHSDGGSKSELDRRRTLSDSRQVKQEASTLSRAGGGPRKPLWLVLASAGLVIVSRISTRLL